MRISDWSSDVCSSDLPICIGIIINFTKGDPQIRCPLLGQTKSGYPLGHTSPTIIAQMLTFVEHHPVGLFLWCQAQALLSLRQPLIDDSSSHGSPFRNFRNNSVISTGEPLRTVTDQ